MIEDVIVEMYQIPVEVEVSEETKEEVLEYENQSTIYMPYGAMHDFWVKK